MRVVHHLDHAPQRSPLHDSQLPQAHPVPLLLLDVQRHGDLLDLLAQVLNVINLEPQTVVYLNIILVQTLQSLYHLLSGEGEAVGDVLEGGAQVLLQAGDLQLTTNTKTLPQITLTHSSSQPRVLSVLPPIFSKRRTEFLELLNVFSEVLVINKTNVLSVELTPILSAFHFDYSILPVIHDPLVFLLSRTR